MSRPIPRFAATPASSDRGAPGSAPAAPAATPGGGAAGPPATAWRAGMVVHGYRLVERLGAGGFGEVWRGENLDHESFALKFGRDDLAADTRAALRREIDVFLRLRGERGAGDATRRPPIVALKQDLLDADPPTLVMEYLAGGDLRAWMRDRAGRRLTFAESLPIVRDLLAALAFAHGRGVVHRDLSPENILLDRDARRWKVTDFGVGGFLAETELSFLRSGASSQLSREVVGKIDYMAPEMRRGEAVGPATDLYSLGVVWVQLLTGRMESGLTATWMRHVPPEALPILERCLEDDPRLRWRDAADLAAAIEDAADAAGVQAPARTAGSPDGGLRAAVAEAARAGAAGAPPAASGGWRAALGRLRDRLPAGDWRGAVVAALLSAVVVAAMLALVAVSRRQLAEDLAATRAREVEQVRARVLAEGSAQTRPAAATASTFASESRRGSTASDTLASFAADRRATGERVEPAPVDPSLGPAPAPPLPEPRLPVDPVAPLAPPVAPATGDSPVARSREGAPTASPPAAFAPPGERPVVAIGWPFGIHVMTPPASTPASSAAPLPVPSHPDGTFAFLSWSDVRQAVAQAEASLPGVVASLDDLSRRGETASILRVASRSSDLPVLRVVEPLLEARRLAPPRVVEEAISRADDVLAELDLDRMMRERGAAAVHLMAGLMEKGLISVGDEGDPVAWYEAAGRAGHLPSLTRLGEMHYYGRRVARDTIAARRYFEEAARAGEPRAMYNLAVLIEDLARATGEDAPPGEARGWYERAAAEGDVPSMLALADLAGDDEALRVEWTRRAAQAGDADALAALARLYEEGRGVAREPVRAAELYARAADKDHPGALNNLAGLLLEGAEGIPPDRTRALELYRRAEALGSAEAAANLARLEEDRP